MVRLTLLFVFMLATLSAAVKVSVDLDDQSLRPGQSIRGTVTVIYGSNQKVDDKGFLIGSDPLEVSLTSTEALRGEKKSIYEFSLPAKQKGIQVLPVISVPVDGKKYTTVSKTYTINGGVPGPAQSQYGSAQKGKTWLKLESFVEGRNSLYPGQRTIVGYRFYFNGNIQLVDEHFPLLEADGFKKIGDLNTKDLKEKNYTVRQIAQEIEAVKPGEYVFSEAQVSGYVYTGFSGQQVPLEDIKATAPPVTIKVLSFPAGNKPASFNGAIGNFTFNMRLLSLPEVSVGDKLTMSIEITGKGDLDEVPMPEICCQPGFSGSFQQSDIPPAGIIKGDTKVYVVDIRPLSEKLTQIPPLEFSFFNPDTRKYETLKSNPIPITVHPADTPFNKALQQPSASDERPSRAASAAPVEEEHTEDSTRGIEISGNARMSTDDLGDGTFSSWWTLIIIPFVLGGLWLQVQMKKAMEIKQQALSQQDSEAWMAKAREAGSDLAKLCHALDKAFISLLREKGIIAGEDITPHQLPQEGVCGDVRAFLTNIEEKRFAGKGELSPENVLSEAQKLFDDIKRSRMS